MYKKGTKKKSVLRALVSTRPTRKRSSSLVEVRAKGQITLPTDVRRDLGIDEGHYMAVKVEKGRLVLLPMDPSQIWFWSSAWQAGEREASEQIASGQVTRAMNTDQLFEALDED